VNAHTRKRADNSYETGAAVKGSYQCLNTAEPTDSATSPAVHGFNDDRQAVTA
jgi:hypothetical protein